MANLPEYVRIANRFLDYAALCRANADHPPLHRFRPALLKMAERWERDAKRVLEDGALIATSRALLDRVEDVLVPVSGTKPVTTSRVTRP